MEAKNEKKNKKDLIIFWVSIILGGIFTFLVISVSPLYEATSKGEPTEAEYKLLKEYAVTYAKTLNKDFIEEDYINITSKVYDGKFLVTVTKTNRATVKATYPIKVESANSDIVITEIAVDKGDYEEISDYNTFQMFGTAIIGMFIFSLLEYFKIEIIVRIVLKIKNKIKKHQNN